MERVRLKDLEQLVGLLVSVCPAIAYGWLYYKSLERLEVDSLFKFNFNVESYVTLDENIKDDLKWWKDHIKSSVNKIRTHKFDLEIFSDASLTGWGAICNDKEARGFWNSYDSNFKLML